MKIITMFRTPRPKQFEYRPIYYDPRKDELKERESRIKQELGLADKDSPRGSMIKGRIREHYEKRIKGRGDRKSTLRLVVIFVVLCLIAYYLIFM